VTHAISPPVVVREILPDEHDAAASLRPARPDSPWARRLYSTGAPGGEGLGYRHEVTAGDFVYIPAGVPHLPSNTGDEPIYAVIGRTDPSEQESVVLMPELDDVHQARSAS
jgi:Cupin domain